MITKDGDYYIGHWKDGMMHGPGMHVKGPIVREGMWDKNTFIGRFDQ